MWFWEILSAFNSTNDAGVWYASLEEYRRLMDCEDKYPSTKDLINNNLI
jgi:hypothetical protein